MKNVRSVKGGAAKFMTQAVRVDPVTGLVPRTSKSGVSYILNRPIEGFRFPLTGLTTDVVFVPGRAIQDGGVLLPSKPADGQRFKVISTQPVAAFTVVPAPGDQVSPSLSQPFLLSSGTRLELIYILSDKLWI